MEKEAPQMGQGLKENLRSFSEQSVLGNSRLRLFTPNFMEKMSDFS